MPGVSITVHNTATNQDRSVVTDAAGAYVTAALAPGHYEVTAHIDGFQDQDISLVRPSEIGAMEVYNGAVGGPPGTNRGCGVIMIWTKR